MICSFRAGLDCSIDLSLIGVMCVCAYISIYIYIFIYLFIYLLIFIYLYRETVREGRYRVCTRAHGCKDVVVFTAKKLKPEPESLS